MRRKTPPLLQRMIERQVGDLVVFRDKIVEPKTQCRVAHSFPNEAAAIRAAEEMNEVADWFGVIKTRSEGLRPNCQDELKAIAERHGGKLGDGAGDQRDLVKAVCSGVVAKFETQH